MIFLKDKNKGKLKSEIEFGNYNAVDNDVITLRLLCLYCGIKEMNNYSGNFEI